MFVIYESVCTCICNFENLCDESFPIIDNANFEKLTAGHNFYPRPETGLDAHWMQKKNEWLKQYGLKTAAFISGNGKLRGPIFAGFPTSQAPPHTDGAHDESDRVVVVRRPNILWTSCRFA